MALKKKFDHINYDCGGFGGPMRMLIDRSRDGCRGICFFVVGVGDGRVEETQQNQQCIYPGGRV